MADLQWHDDGNYHWCTWSVSSDNKYKYHIRLAANSYRNGGGLFNMFNSLPNVNAPSGGEKVAVLNGGIFYPYDGAYYNIGPEVAWYQNVLQENFGGQSDYLAMGSWGENFSFGTVGSIYDNYPLVLGGPARSNGTGEGGCDATTSHAFIGKGGSVNYMGWCTGVKGSTCVNKMTGKYGGKCMILDGGGSTQMWYMGSTKRASSDGSYRNIKNAIVLYRTVNSSEPEEPDDPAVQPEPGTGTIDNTQTDIKGLSYILKNGELKKANPWYYLKDGQLIGRPLCIYRLQGDTLQPLIKRFSVDLETYDGEYLPDKNYYWGESVALTEPTHGAYDGHDVHFWGWFTDTTFSDQVSSIGTDASGDKSYYAKWLQYKKQYKGDYTYTGTATMTLTDPDSSVTNSTNTNQYWCFTQFSKETTITHVKCDFDCSTASWTNYVKPEVWLCVGPDSNWQNMSAKVKVQSKGGSAGSKDVNVTVPAGHYICLRATWVRDNGQTKMYFNNASIKYGGTVTETVNWQDSQNPPKGNWASGYPTERYVQRYYNGTSWTDWKV